MNFLSLCQRARVKCRIAGSGPSAVTGQSAEYARLIVNVNEAWMAIQREHRDWNFMRASCSAPTINGTYAYTASSFGIASDFGYWAVDDARGDTFRCYTTSVGLSDEQFLDVMQYDDWRNLYLMGSNRTNYQRPCAVAAAPDRSLVVGPVAAGGYTLVGDYYKRPTEMSANDDIPALPEQFHMAIVYRAMMYWGVAEAAPEVYDEGKSEYDRMIREIEAAELPQMTMAGPLV